VKKWTRVVEPLNLVPHVWLSNSQDLGQGPEARRRGGRQTELAVALEQTKTQMIEIAEQPTALRANSIGGHLLRTPAERELRHQEGEIDSGIDGELQ
jgi:hypothetical protein